MCTWYKYNTTLYDLITKKYKAFVTCVYCYHVIITFYCKNNDSKKKIVKLVIFFLFLGKGKMLEIVKYIIYVCISMVMWVNN